MPRYRPAHRRPSTGGRGRRRPVRLLVTVVLLALVGGVVGVVVARSGGRPAKAAATAQHHTGSQDSPPASPASVRRASARSTDRLTSSGTVVRPRHRRRPAPTYNTPQGVVARWVVKENARPGTRDWVLSRPATDHQIEGYADHVSVDPVRGSPVTVRLYVSTPAPSYQIQAFRMGWYGGDQGRLVWTSATLSGQVQPTCPLTAGVNMVECAWSPSASVAVTAGRWPQGDYLFKLEASTGYQSYIPLTVRDDASHATYLLNNSVTTWQAYNLYGGYDLYQGLSPSHRGLLAYRSSIVSFDRPYALAGDDGAGSAGDFVGLELKMVTMMESLGLDVSYTTDVDVDLHPNLLEQHKAFISLGHDEYYSLAMRNAVIAARDAGVNLVFLGANAIYRHIRFEDSPLGVARREVDYKNPDKDPLLGKDNADVTPWAWRDPPNNSPESSILGEMWQCNPVQADMVITDPGSWMFDGTGLVAGSRIAGIVGPEYDHFSPFAPNPGDVSVVARSPVVCGGRASTADMTYYSAPASHAGVWDTGTIDWVGSVMPFANRATAPNVVTRITDNVIAAFGAGPAGIAHPSTANVTG